MASRSDYINYALRSKLKRVGALSSATASAAIHGFAPADQHHVNRLGRSFPGLWHTVLDIKRRIPRGLHFYILFFAWLALNCIWVLPITFTYKNAAQTALEQQLCFNWITNQTNATSPIDNWYFDPSAPSHPPNNNSLAYRGESFCANATPIPLNSVDVSVDFQQFDVQAYKKITSIAGSNRKIQWLPVLDEVNADALQTYEGVDLEAAAFWRQNMPSLASLALIGDIYPTGIINPAEGKLSLLMQLQTVLSYPGQLPTLHHAHNQSEPYRQGLVTEELLIKWNVTCNGQTITFSSDTGMTGNMRLDCTSQTVPLQGASPSMYPFDVYQFPIAVLAQAQVTSLRNPSLSIQTAVPYMQTLFSTTPGFEFSRVEDEEELFTYSWWTEGASYIFPRTYKYLIPNQLQVLTVYQVERAGFVKAWSLLINIMMWVVSSCQFVLTLDQVLLRPRDVFWGQGMGALTLVWTLPSIRSSQPGVPSIGIVMDVGSFFWCELMAITAAAMLITAQFSSFKFGLEVRRRKEKEFNDREAAFKKLLEEEAKVLDRLDMEAEARAEEKAKAKQLAEETLLADPSNPLIEVQCDARTASKLGDSSEALTMKPSVPGSATLPTETPGASPRPGKDSTRSTCSSDGATEEAGLQLRRDKLRLLLSERVDAEFAAEMLEVELGRLVASRLDNAKNLASISAKEDLMNAPLALPLGVAARLVRVFSSAAAEGGPPAAPRGQ